MQKLSESRVSKNPALAQVMSHFSPIKAQLYFNVLTFLEESMRKVCIYSAELQQ